MDKLAQDLGKQLWYILGRTLEAVRGSDPGPQQVVTALRIIEREERSVMQRLSSLLNFVRGFPNSFFHSSQKLHY